jgi:Fe-S-cluster containining protein
MSDSTNSSLFANYRLLVSRVDELCREINSSFKTAINCRPGCSACCRHLTIFPVEAAVLVKALQRLPLTSVELLAELPDLTEEGPCPFLRKGLCRVYEDRPIICRTHGLPILTEAGGERRVDFCPENFRDMASLPGSGIVNLDALNQALVAINAQFVNETDDNRFREKERFSFADIIRMALDNRNHTKTLDSHRETKHTKN